MTLPAFVRMAAVLGCLLGFPAGVACAWEPIKAHPQNPYILQFRGKPTLLHTYAESYSTLVDSGLPYLPYLDVLKRDGMNLTRVWCLGFPPDHPGTAATFLQPWPRGTTGGTALDGLPKWDLSNWDEAYFDRLKAFTQAASDRGIVVEYTLFSVFYEDVLWNKSPFHRLNNVQAYGPGNWNDSLRPVNADLLAVQKAAVRRIVRELNGFDNVIFEVQNEPFWNEPGERDAEEVEFNNIMLGEIRAEEAMLPNRHLVAHNFPQKIAEMAPDFDVLNEHYPLPLEVPVTPLPGAEALLRDHYSLGKILSMDETDSNKGLQTPRHTRLEAWMFLIGGGAIYNGLDPEFLVYTLADPSGDNALGNAVRGAVRNIGIYMNRLHLVALRRDLSWIAAATVPAGARWQASASPGQQYVAYLYHGTGGTESFQLTYDPIDTSVHNVSLRVTLEAGDWRAVWTRPSDLAELYVQEFSHAGGEITLEQVSYNEDVALRIDRTGPGDITPPPTLTGLAAVSNANGSITLTWDPVDAFDLAAYRVYRATAPGVPVDASHRIAVVDAPGVTWLDHPAVPATTYHYVVTAVDHAGNEVSATHEVSVASILPYPDLRLIVNPAGQRVLEWTTGYPGWILQESGNLTAWGFSPLVPVVTGNLYQVIVPAMPTSVFYRLIYIQPPPPDPALRIYGNGGELVLEWPVVPDGWSLQESADLTPGSWTNSLLTPAVAGDYHRVTFTPVLGSRFFRLVRQADPAVPILTLLAGGDGQLILRWKAAYSDWQLQESSDLTPESWVDSELSPTVVGDEYLISISVTPGMPCRFFRLMRP